MFRVVLERDSERHRRKVTEQRNGTEAGGKASPPLWNMVADIPLSLQPGSHWRLITLAGRSGHVHGRPKVALVVAAEQNRIVVGSEPGQGNAALWPLTVIGHPRETIQERAEVQIEAAGGGGGEGKPRSVSQTAIGSWRMSATTVDQVRVDVRKRSVAKETLRGSVERRLCSARQTKQAGKYRIDGSY